MIGRISALSAALLTVAPAALAEPNHVITLTERRPLAFLLNTPTGAIGNTSSSEIIRMVDDLLRRDTSFAVELLESDVVRTCQGRLTCLVLAARRDYERAQLERPDGSVLPYREHVRRMREAEREYSRFLFVLSNVTVEGEADQMSALLIDTDLALGFFHEMDRSRETWQDDVETRITSGALVKPPLRAEVRGADEARAFLEKTLLEDYADVFEASGHWRPFGEIDIESSTGDLEVLLDGRTVGTTQAGVTRLSRVRPGTRSLVLQHPDYARFETTVSVKRSELVSVTTEPERTTEVVSSAFRTAILWTGVGLGAVGTGVAIFAAARADSDTRTVCFGDANCDSGKFQTLGYDPNVAFSQASLVNPDGILVAPLGLALMGAGAGLSLGVLLTDDDTTPWWGVLAGVVAGVAIYGGALALD